LADRIVVFTPRPTAVDRVIEVSFSRPRDESLKSSSAFLDLRREIWAMLKKNVRI
jgi:NitT/TauT family transport system ATP-binding protein